MGKHRWWKAAYLPPATPQRGSREACPWCGRQPANEHSLRESAKCDRARWRLQHPEPEVVEEASS